MTWPSFAKMIDAYLTLNPNPNPNPKHNPDPNPNPTPNSDCLGTISERSCNEELA